MYKAELNQSRLGARGGLGALVWELWQEVKPLLVGDFEMQTRKSYLTM